MITANDLLLGEFVRKASMNQTQYETLFMKTRYYSSLLNDLFAKQ